MYILQPDGMTKGSVTLISAWLLQRKEDGEPLAPKLPLSLVYLASAMVRAGYTAEVVDLQFEDQMAEPSCSVSDLLAGALRHTAPVVAISCMSDMLPFVLVALREWRSSHPESLVILGGPGPSSSPTEILRFFPEIDVIVRGEGEEALIEVLDAHSCLRDYAKIRGICFRDKDRIVVTGERERRANLDDFLPLRYTDFPLQQYHRSIPISTSRGCPYTCSFCSASRLWPHKTTWHSIPAVISLLKILTQDEQQRFLFVDDTFVTDKRRTEYLCDQIVQEIPGISWHCNGRINLMTDSLTERMATAGCHSIFYGIESGSDRMLASIKKGFCANQALEQVKRTSQSIPIVTVSFIWGFPDETWEDFEQTRALYLRMSELPGVHVQLYMLEPYPNIPILEQYSLPLIFDPDILITSEQLHRRPSQKELELIQKYPQFFPCLYRFETPERARKQKIVEKDLYDLP